MNSRVACIYVVDFPLAALVKNRAEMSLYPYAVAESEHPQALLVAVNQVAERDVRIGMTVAQARNRCASLRVLVQDNKLERRESEKVRELLQRVGPHVEYIAPGEYYLDLRGLKRLHGGEDGIARNAIRQFSSSTFAVQIGIASNKLVARIASRRAQANGFLNVPRGNEREFLAPLPIAALGISSATNFQLYTLGLRTIGDITRLPLQEITRRFGEDVRCLAECLRDDDTTPVAPLGFAQEHSAEQKFEDALDNFEQLVENIAQLLQTLLKTLQSSGQGCREITVLLENAYFSPRLIDVKLTKMTASVSAWNRQVRQTMEGVQCAFGVTKIVVTLTNVGPLPANQMSLFAQSDSDDQSAVVNKAEMDKLAIARVTLSQKVLPEDIISSSVWDANASTTCKLSAKMPKCFYAGSALAGLRLFKRPQGVRVTTNNGDIYGIVSASGVERVVRYCAPNNVSGGWWEREFQRSYYEVETDRGMSYLLYRDELQSKWYLQGFFD
ncbi:MAG: hypothetical protein WBP29_13940 [Candidatus Zixiibacteriota bacterium]